MSTTSHHGSNLGGSNLGNLAREMDSPATVIWTSIHVIKRCLEQIAEAQSALATRAGEEDSNSTIRQMNRNVDLAIMAGERLVKVNKSLQRAIHLHEADGGVCHE